MKVAVPVRKNGQIDDHFGHCEHYAIYDLTENGDIENTLTIPSVNGCGCKSNIAGELAEKGVKVMLAGGIGGGAINVLHQAGIQVIRGCAGDATAAVRLFAAGKLTDSGESCSHHEHHHGHGHSH